MKGLDAAVHHLWKTREFGDIDDCEPGIAEPLGGAPGGDQFDAMAHEKPPKLNEAGFIGNAEKGAGNGKGSGISHGWN
jgi:hypothetical protein